MESLLVVLDQANAIFLIKSVMHFNKLVMVHGCHMTSAFLFSKRLLLRFLFSMLQVPTTCVKSAGGNGHHLGSTRITFVVIVFLTVHASRRNSNVDIVSGELGVQTI